MDQQTVESSASSEPRRSVEQIPTSKEDVLAFVFRGPITAEDFRRTASTLEAAYSQHGSVDLLLRIAGPMTMRLEVFRERFLGVKRAGLRHINRYAVVGGPDWLEGAVEFLNPLFRVEVRHFDLDDEDDAWEWLDVAPTPIAAN